MTTIDPAPHRLAPRRRRRTIVTATIALTVTALAGCGGGDQDAAPRPARPSVGAAPTPVLPTPADGGGDVGGDGSGFSGIFGPPTGRLDGAPEATLPPDTLPPDTRPAETVPAETVPAETVPAETVPAETVPPAPSPTTPPTAAPAPTADPGRIPVAPLAPDFEQWRAGFAEINAGLAANDATISVLPLDGTAFTTEPSMTIIGGSVAAAPLDGGLVGALLDTDGTVAGSIVFGNMQSDAVFSAVLTMLVQLTTGAELDAVATHLDDATVTDVENLMVPAADGGYFSISSSGGLVTFIKFQDASADWVDANAIFFYSDALLTVPLPG